MIALSIIVVIAVSFLIAVIWCHFLEDVDLWKEFARCYGCSKAICPYLNPDYCDEVDKCE